MGMFNKDDKPKQDINEKHRSEINELLLPGEEIEYIYPLFIDFLCLTNKRLIFVDKDLSFKEPKTTIYSTPYKNILSVGLEKNEKVFAFTDKLAIVTKGKTHELKFLKVTNIKDVYNNLVQKII